MRKREAIKLQRRVEDMLTRFYFVRWDRFILDDEGYTIYGWMDRTKDKYKDFITLTLYYPGAKGEHWSFVTSSAARHDQILEIMALREHETTRCKRVENFFDVANAIKLKKV